MSLIDRIMENDKHGLFNCSNVFANYSTGILPLDYINAFKLRWRDKDGRDRVDVVPGIMGGKFLTIIGLSGSGKTTLADQIAWNIIEPFENDGMMIHVDAEHSMLKPRIYDITDMPLDDPRFKLQDENTYIEDVMEQIDIICRAKEAAGDEAKYEIDGKWFNRDTVKVYYPTVIIIDSLWAFTSKDTKEDVLEGQMSTNREVGKISQFYQKQASRLAKYNITIIATNHIKSKIETNPYSYTKPQLMMLKQDESLPRGQAPVYSASSVLRLNPAGLSKGYTKAEWGFDGFKCILQVAKSKTTFIGGEVNLVFREDIGYDPIYTILQFAYDCDLVLGKNPHLRIKGAEDYLFSKITFGTKFKKDFKFRTAILTAIQPYLEALAGCKDVTDEERERYTSMAKLNDDGMIEVDPDAIDEFLPVEDIDQKKTKKKSS